jgi:parallel beta-helix repeat protein
LFRSVRRPRGVTAGERGPQSTRPLKWLGAVIALAVVAVFAAGSSERSAASPTGCTRYASVTGSNSNPGTLKEPYRTIAHLLGTLSAGDTGCLLPGLFQENVRFNSGGSPGRPLTLTSVLDTDTMIYGTVYVPAAANDVVISRLLLNGTNSSNRPSPIVNGDRVSLVGNDITNWHSAICVLLGPGFEDPSQRAIDPVVEGNRIHDCGRLPASGHDHGVYVEGTTNARIVGNLIYDNADYGIHLYPDADGSVIENNVVDGNGGGLIFAGERAGGEYGSAHSSDNNVVRANIFSNNAMRNNLESWWGGPTGAGNLVSNNCFWNGHPRDIDDSAGGFVHVQDRIADPLYVDRLHKNFALQPKSPCAGLGPVGPPPVAGPPAPPSPNPKSLPITIGPRLVVVKRSRHVSLRLTNTSAQGGLVRGALTLSRTARAGRARLGRARFALPPRKTRTVSLRLSRSSVKALRRLRRMPARATATGRDALGATRTGSRVLAIRRARRS